MKLIRLGLFVLLLAGLAQADTNYFVKTTGFWQVNANWNADTGAGTINLAPVNDPLAKVNSKSGTTITLVNSARVGFLALNSGDSTLDVVIDGGALRSEGDGNGTWNAIGYNRTSSMLIKNGGSWICDGRVDVGLFDGVNGQVNTFTMAADSGNVTVSNDFSIGRSFDGSHSASARADILGGTLRIGGGINIASAGANLMDISGTASVIIDGDKSAEVQSYILNGKITGNGGTGTAIYDYNASHPGKTTVRAIAGQIVPDWQLAQAVYTTNELIVTPFDALTDFGIVGDGVTDVTQEIQDALVVIANLGGGSLFLPEGFYKVDGNLTIPAGVTLRGDWKKPEPGQPIVGTVLMAYAGRDNENGQYFITLSGSGGVNGVAVWYPEQLPGDIRPYPITFGNGGAATIENITLVNAYFGFSSYREGTTGRPFVRGIYGTPLKTGIEFDCIADIGRIETVHFSPDYWAGSGLTNAPTGGEHEAWLYNNATGIMLRRLDWSYSCYVTVEGYNIGVALRPSRWDGKVPNGQSYDFSLIDCKYGVYDEASAYAGYQMTRFSIQGAETGVYISPSHTESVMFHTCAIEASEVAVLCEAAAGRLIMTSCDIQQGTLRMDAGYLSVINTDFRNTTALNIELGSDVRGAALLGNRFTNGTRIYNDTLYPVEIDHTPLSLDPLPPYDYKKPESGYVPSETNLYVVTEAPYNAQADGVTDDTAAFQSALSDADADGGGTVFVPAGNYRLDGTLVVPTGVELRGIFDIPHGTNIKGSLLNIYSGHNVSNGVPFIQLEADSGVKGLNFHYPNQIYDGSKTNANETLGFVPYPFMIRGLGSDVYVVNISATIPYELLDLATEQCDRHYVDYIFSTCLKTGIWIGGGSADGNLHNIQFNPNSYTFRHNEYESIPQGTSTLLHLLMKRDATPFLFGHMTNQVVHECFVFSGARGMHLVEENGQGPSGHCMGMGIDAAIHAYQIDDVGAGDFQPINSQIVATDGVKGRYLVTGPSLTDTFKMFSSAGWGSHQYSAVIQGGDIRLQNFHLARDGETGAFKIENNATVESYAGNLDDYLANGKPFLTIDPTAAASFIGNIINTVEAQMPVNTANVAALGNLRIGAPATSLPGITTTEWDPGSTGEWLEDSNWTGDASPLSQIQNLKVVFNVDGAQACVLNNTATVAQLIMGDSTPANSSFLTLGNGAHLTSGLDGNGGVNWTAVGYNRSAAMTVEAGAEMTCRDHLLIGFIAPSIGTLNIDGGTVNVFNQLGLGWNGGTGYVNISSGGLLDVVNFDAILSINGASIIDIESGTMIIDGNETNAVNDYILAGRITASGGAGTLNVDYGTSTPGRTTVWATAPSYGYNAWVTGWGVDIGDSTNDYDGDLSDNFYEYALNGDPTNSLDAGVHPFLVDAAGAFDYIHLQRNDDTNLVYQVEISTNLVSGTWTNTGYTVTGTNLMGGGTFYDEVTNRISTVEEQTFIRLNVGTGE